MGGRRTAIAKKRRVNLKRAHDAKKIKTMDALTPLTSIQQIPSTSMASSQRTPATSGTSSQLYLDPTRVKPKGLLPQQPVRAPDFKGRRIVSCDSLTTAIRSVCEHAKICEVSNMHFNNEVKVGVKSDIHYSCICGWNAVIQSDTGNEQYSVNEGLGWGCMNSTTGHDDLTTLLTCIDIPPPSWYTYKNNQDIVEDHLLEALEKNMKEAGIEEQRLAIESGDFTNVGGITMPSIAVYVDGGWAIRSYTHSYTSNYGHAAIIGVRTKKVLYVGIRQKYCFVCTKYENKGFEAPIHTCGKNWNKSSSAMEASILKDGFENSPGMHQMVYSTFIGDGDSSVFHSVKDIYPGAEVQKIECINHVIRNVNTKLTQISNPGKSKWQVSQDERRIPGMESRFKKIGRLLHTLSRHYNALGDHVTYFPELAGAIGNIAAHVFGNHLNCETFYCDKTGQEDPSFQTMKNLVIYHAVSEVLTRPANLARSLIACETSNVVESFMGSVAKMIEGKRKNLGGMGLYKAKIAAAAFSFNTTSFFAADASKYLTTKSPNLLWKKRQLLARKRRRSGGISKHKPRVLRFNFLKPKGDANYGENPIRPDLSDIDLNLAVKALWKTLQVDITQQQQIEAATKAQADSELWLLYRKNRLTASNVGKLFKLRDSTNNLATIKSLTGKSKLYGSALFNVQFGKDNEPNAIAKYEELMGLAPGTVEPSGFFVSLKDGIFGASPDGLINGDGILEVKCPISIKDGNPNDWYKVSSSPLQLKDGIISLKRSHDHFYQVITQLIVTNRAYCDYFIWTSTGYFCERILLQEAKNVWPHVEQKLRRFWNEDLAPEIVDSRLERGIKNCRLPSYRSLAMNKLPKKNSSASQK